jgi:hypothetical protein
VDVKVQRIALNMDQIRQYDPPPNPAKQQDSRFKAYAAKHGDESWELDALDPKVIQALVSETIQDYLDPGPFESRKRAQAKDEKKLDAIIAGIDKPKKPRRKKKRKSKRKAKKS